MNDLMSGPIDIDLADAAVRVWPGYFDLAAAGRYMSELTNEINWIQEKAHVYGKTHNLPRLTAWYGDAGKSYRYSGIRVTAQPWTPLLLEIKDKVEQLSNGETFNSVLLNLYRSGDDCVGWHSDDEAELGSQPLIGSVSFGASRLFQLKHKTKLTERRTFVLNSGDVLLMQGDTQRHWQHQIPRTRKPMGPRINLTFRRIVT
jgi:alkylated DNA repair dioxygenase AlkB